MMKQRLLDWSLRIKKWGKRLVIGFVLLYVLATIDSFFFIKRSPICPVEEHSFSGQKYDIDFCISHGAYYNDYMHLRIFSKSGELLAARGATFHKEGRLNYMAIMSNQIRYSDDPMDQINPPLDCVLNMPPTKIDWWEARLPGGLPGVNHCRDLKFQDRIGAMDVWERQDAERQVKRKTAQAQPSVDK